MKRQTTLLQAVIVLGGFLALAFLCNQSGIEIHLALFAAWFLAMAVGKRNGFSYQEMEHAVTKGIYDGMSAILILLAVGALVGTWISGGIVRYCHDGYRFSAWNSGTNNSRSRIVRCLFR